MRKIVVIATAGAIIGSTTYKQTLTITVSAVKLDADTPKVPGPGVIDLAVTFTAYDNGSSAPLTITYQTSDSSL